MINSTGIGLLKQIAAGLVCVVALAVTPAHATQGTATPTVYGKSIGNWGLAWWQWAANFNLADNPITQPSGTVDCVAGQQGSVWFIAGTFGGDAVRTCNVKYGKALFFPIINSLFWSPEDCAATDMKTCRAKAAAQGNDSLIKWTCEVDGKPCVYTNQIVRDQSNALPFNILPQSWIVDFGYTPGVRDAAISDGYWVMLEPLRKGAHVIRFTAEASDGFKLDVTYNLTVTQNP